MIKISLVIMAAGIGSRFGGGIKQLEPVGPNGEIIMDYSIYDAIKSGFNKIIFIIRKDIEKDFKEVIGNRIEKICKKLNVEVHYAYQELDNISSDFKAPKDRKKPWGTGHAVLSCKDIINEPFVVINADDYYGKDSFKNMYEFLNKNNNEFCMAGFKLKNTLSDNGAFLYTKK
ncbi:sugar phosphate nucleotidyltransferase [Fusobacterium sp.]|uniref:sugar phosphate nucleotidyltransferase n=1 Tax=Fusobacterium sp. TaxID=68766 RepID=UPI002E77ECEF|nr:sugar phosphate nucleotidyltransferase [Fusobacterium sp.]MEE1475880.1 sugar phosphate nucleotidyltransferase [Fusobacterium sp.]